MPTNRKTFFDSIADSWDDNVNLSKMMEALEKGFESFGVGKDEIIADIGCGTGNLTLALTKYLGETAKIHAVDYSEKMIEAAKKKVDDSRVRFHTADVEHLPFEAESFDRVICFSAWPHFPSPKNAALEFRRILKPGGIAHIWHSEAKEKINAIHTGVGGEVAEDILAPAKNLADFLNVLGFESEEIVDTQEEYRVSIRKIEAR